MSKYGGFQNVMLNKPKRSYFDMSHQKRSSTRMGRLTPVFITEAIPGDSWHCSSEILLRLAPLLAPIYDQIQLFVHFFFVPNRLIWEDWEEFITGGRLGVGVDPLDAPVPPWMNIGNAYGAGLADGTFAKSSLADYLGVPIIADLTADPENDYDGVPMDVMPFAVYQLVWFEYYRDRNYVSDEFFVTETGGTDIPLPSGNIDSFASKVFMTLRTRAYLHDYFTSALPSTQRGVEVLMPLAGSGSVSYLQTSQLWRGAEPQGGSRGGTTVTIDPGTGPTGGTPGFFLDAAGQPVQVRNIDEVMLDSSSVSINDFRSAYALQVWLERNEIAGSRYVESNLAHFGVRSQDSRLQRPEYLGGGRIPVKISEVVSTAYSEDGVDTVPLANLAGHGITYGNTNRFSYFCPEHGFIIGIASIMNPPSYHQGLPRMFRRSSFLDYPWPTFAKLGEQEVHKYELYASPANLTETDGEVPLFGYQSRYADWKYVANTNHGDFHDTLLFWTLTREFASSPTLGQSFVEFEDSTQDRIFAVAGDQDNFWMYIHNKCGVKRALPYFGTPNTLGFS